MTDKAEPDRDNENFARHDQRSGAILFAAIQASPHRDLEIEPLSFVFTVPEVVFFD